MTKNEIKTWLDNNLHILQDIHGTNEDTEYFEETEKIGIEFVDSYGGMDKGSEYWSIISFPGESRDSKILVKLDGYYQSYSGSTFQKWFFVKEKEIKKVIYVKDE